MNKMHVIYIFIKSPEFVHVNVFCRNELIANEQYVVYFTTEIFPGVVSAAQSLFTS